jgi:hypothetical protein
VFHPLLFFKRTQLTKTKTMKKCVITLILSLIFAKVTAPEFKSIMIFEVLPCYIFNLSDPLARAVGYQESRFNPYAVNKVSGARGFMQITLIMIREANRIKRLQGSDERYKWKDAFDPDKSIEIWYLVQNFHNPSYNLEKACKIWFGSGVQYDGMTHKEYANQIKKHYKE